MENKNWMNNRFWFYAFTILIVLILIAIIYVFTSITDSSKSVNESNEQTSKDFTVSFNNAELQSLMNATLKDYDIETEITKNDLIFNTTTQVLNRDINIKLDTIPTKVNKDTIKFKIQSIDIGKLNISNPFVLSQIKKYSDLPEYINIDPKEETIYLSLDKIDIDNVDAIQIQTLDISAKKWYFDIKLK